MAGNFVPSTDRPCAKYLGKRWRPGFSFRLLAAVRDSNYAHFDSGEGHVFGLLWDDGQACHLHFHSNGKFDKPRFIEAQALAVELRSSRERSLRLCGYYAPRATVRDTGMP